MTNFLRAAPGRATEMLERVAALLPAMQQRAGALDRAGAFPGDDITALRAAGLLAAPLPEAAGGIDAGTAPEGAAVACMLLRLLGRGNASVARLWEAHVNALRLILRYGTVAQATDAAQDALAGHLFGLWVTDPPGRAALRAEGSCLRGMKGPCSGAGHCTRALVTVEDGGGTRMAVIALAGTEPVAMLDGLQGMRAAAQGTVRLDGVPIRFFLGEPGDYLREPEFSCGAWRGSAAASGVLDAIVEVVRGSLTRSGRGGVPLQLARFGELCMAQETARLWVERACGAAEEPGIATGERVATVGLARLAVERACLEGMVLAQRALGMASFVAPHPLERLGRDLATYLRQPAPDEVLLEAAGEMLRRGAAELAAVS